jgi:hypothetical protein
LADLLSSYIDEDGEGEGVRCGRVPARHDHERDVGSKTNRLCNEPHWPIIFVFLSEAHLYYMGWFVIF